MRGLLFVVLSAGAVACGAAGAGKGAAKPAQFKVGAKVRIIDGGQIFDALNTTDCIAWPSASMKKKAGRDAWGGFTPGTGNEGTVLATATSCHDAAVVIVQVGDYVVPVTEKGLQSTEKPKTDANNGSISVATGPATGGQGYGYGGIGFGGDGYGGRTGTATGASGYKVGDSIQVTDPGMTYDQINQTDCVSWPSDDVKQKAGASAWGGWFPSQGDVGTVLALPPNSCGTSDQLLLVDDGGHIVPIGTSGVTHH